MHKLWLMRLVADWHWEVSRAGDATIEGDDLSSDISRPTGVFKGWSHFASTAVLALLLAIGLRFLQ